MKELLSRVSEKGQVTIPLEVRRALQLKPRDKVTFKIEGGEVKIAVATGSLESSFQAIAPIGRSLSDDEMIELALREHTEQVSKEGL